MELKKALQTALQFEKKGHELYVDAAKRSKHMLVKKTFLYLAGQEIIHVRDIQHYIEKTHPDIKLAGDKPDDIKMFFSVTIREFKKRTDLSQDDIKAYETALEFERNAYLFYKKNFASTEDKDSQRFFKFLMEQENFHYLLLKKTYDYVKDPAEFHKQHENWIFEG
jgi:rubrerythrin